MKITATNGNARNGIKGQLIRFISRNGTCADAVHLKAGSGLRREALERISPSGAPVSAPAYVLADLFAASKARLSIRHNRRFP